MGKKKAAASLKTLQEHINKLSHAVGALTSCKSAHEGYYKQLLNSVGNYQKFNKTVEHLNKNRKEFKKKWGEWEKYAAQAENESAFLKKYCKDNAAKHKHRRSIKKALGEIAKDVEQCDSDIEYCVKLLKGFQPVYDTIKKQKGVKIEVQKGAGAVADPNYVNIAEVLKGLQG